VPLMVDFKLKGLSLNDICTCKVVKYKAYNWNEGCKDDVKRDLLANWSKIDDLMNSINVDTGNIDDIVNEMNVILSNIAEKYTKSELTKTVMCDYCRNDKRRNLTTNVTRDKPWKTDECKCLHIDYNRALSKFNKNRRDENRLELNLSKQRFKRMENNMKSRYKDQRGNMLSSMRRTNPKYFYKKFRKRKKTVNSNISLVTLSTISKN
jgi:hypothetical protein